MRSMRVLCSVALGVFAAVQLSGLGPKHWFVSNAGVDPDCTLSKPCALWQTAIALASSGDEITALNSGDFGDIDIESGHAVTIDSGGADAGVLSGTVTINIGDTETAVLRGLDLNGAGSAATSVGITFSGGANLIIDGCEIENYGKRGISIQSITDGAKVLISNSVVSSQANNGIVVIPPAVTNSVVLDRVRVVGNGNSGVGVNAGGVVEIRDSVISNNVNWGLLVGGTNVSVENTSLSGNLIAIQAGNGSVRLSNVNVWNNATGLVVAAGGTISSFGNNQLHGNGNNGPSPTLLVLQ